MNQREADQRENAEKFDFLNNPKQLHKMREESRESAMNEWKAIDQQTKFWSVIKQYYDFTQS